MSFRDRHRFLDGIFNSYPDPELITAKGMGDVARKVGLLMDEVLSWFEDEKLRRTKFLAIDQNRSQNSACQFPPSPESTTARGSDTSASPSYYSASPGQSSQSLDAFPPKLAPICLETPAPSKPKRGRPAKSKMKIESNLSSPDAKRKKVSVKYPCPDCGNLQPIERWTEHFNRSHFPENVWECSKINRRTGKPCSSRSNYRPSYRIDNFVHHLESEHGCSDSEIDKLKRVCKREVTNFFHNICGFPLCEQIFGSRTESLEHIKQHFREISETPNPPSDFGLSQWKHRCGSEHELQLGVHYRRNRGSNSDLKDEDHDHDEDEGPDEGNWDNHGPDDRGFQPDNSSKGADGGFGDEQGKDSGSGDGFISDTQGFQRQVKSQEPISKEDSKSQCPVDERGKSLDKSYSNKAHTETRGTNHNTLFPCLFRDCDKEFMTKSDLQQHHQSIHMKQRNHRCDSCKSLFAQKDTLKR